MSSTEAMKGRLSDIREKDMNKNPRAGRNKDRTVIPLEDLAPRKDPKGGGGSVGRAVFGEGPITGTSEGKAAGKKVRKDR